MLVLLFGWVKLRMFREPSVKRSVVTLLAEVKKLKRLPVAAASIDSNTPASTTRVSFRMVKLYPLLMLLLLLCCCKAAEDGDVTTRTLPSAKLVTENTPESDVVVVVANDDIAGLSKVLVLTDDIITLGRPLLPATREYGRNVRLMC